MHPLGALLIMDEVMTSRLSPGGLQAVTWGEAGPDDAGKVYRRRHVVRRLRRTRDVMDLFIGAARRAAPRRHVQQQRPDGEQAADAFVLLGLGRRPPSG